MPNSMNHASENCFFEKDPKISLGRRAFVEAAGTLFLVLAAASSGLAALRLQDTPLLAHLVSAVATSAALVGLIVALGAVSGGHFNPLITILQWLSRDRSGDCTLAYIGAQTIGAVGGALLGNLIYGVQRHAVAARPGLPQLALSEFLAATALMIVVFGCVRSERKETGPFAVGAWLTSGILALPSASYANPVIVLAALFVDGPMALAPRTALVYALVELAGALVALLIIGIAYPRARLRPPAHGVTPVAPDTPASA